VAQEARQIFTLLSLVSRGFGVSFMLESARLTGFAGVAFLSIADLADSITWELAMAWLPDRLSPSAASFLDMVKAIVAARERRDEAGTRLRAQTSGRRDG
jgi:hypothetical protein